MSDIRITLQGQGEMYADVTVEDKLYKAETTLTDEGMTTVFRLKGGADAGTITETLDVDLTGASSVEAEGAMLAHLERAIRRFAATLRMNAMRPSDFVRVIRGLMRKGSGEAAYKYAREGYRRYPGDQILASYYGGLCSTVGHDARSGIRLCQEAVAEAGGSLTGTAPKGVRRANMATLYTNLGRAFLGSGSRERGVAAFHHALSFEPGNTEARAELKRLGMRRRPLIPFLPRSSALNRMAGMLMRRMASRVA